MLHFGPHRHTRHLVEYTILAPMCIADLNLAYREIPVVLDSHVRYGVVGQARHGARTLH
jgi:hypothetical protein